MVDGEINCSLKDASACENKERRKRFTGPTSVFASKVVLSARNRYEKKKEKKRGEGKKRKRLQAISAISKSAPYITVCSVHA